MRKERDRQTETERGREAERQTDRQSARDIGRERDKFYSCVC